MLRPGKSVTRTERRVRVCFVKMRTLLLAAVSLLLCLTALGQSCPAPGQHGGSGAASGPSTLHGNLVFHDELRQWLGLKLDRPTCGQTDIQLIFVDAKAWRSAASFRGCAITLTGTLFYAPTGYFSAEMAVSLPALKPDSSCHPFPVEPDPTTTPIPLDLKRFGASITVDYRGNGHVSVRVWESANKQALQPWEAFVHYHLIQGKHYNLTGAEDVIWFGCRGDFRISDLKQTPQAPNGFIQNEPDSPGTVLQDVHGVNRVEFGCEKTPASPSQARKLPERSKPHNS